MKFYSLLLTALGVMCIAGCASQGMPNFGSANDASGSMATDDESTVTGGSEAVVGLGEGEEFNDFGQMGHRDSCPSPLSPPFGGVRRY